MHTAGTMPPRDEALQQCRSLARRAARLVRLWPGVGVKPCLIGLKGSPIDEAGMVIRNEDGPLIHGEMANAFSDGALFIDVAFVPGLAVGVSASIYRSGENVVERGVSRSEPPDRTGDTSRRGLQGDRQGFGE